MSCPIEQEKLHAGPGMDGFCAAHAQTSTETRRRTAQRREDAVNTSLASRSEPEVVVSDDGSERDVWICVGRNNNNNNARSCGFFTCERKVGKYVVSV